MWKLLIAEDQQIVRQGIKLMLEQDEKITVVAEAENGEQVLQLLRNQIVDLVVLDIRMPIMNGLEVTRKIKKSYPQMKILILTTFNDDEYAIQALKDGANGFLLKTSDANKLLQAVHSCMSGGITIQEEVAAKVVPRLLEKSREQKSPLPLTERELAITRLVGEGKTNKEIATELFLSIGTVKNHITQILQKLHLRDRTQLAIFAVKNDLS